MHSSGVVALLFCLSLLAALPLVSAQNLRQTPAPINLLFATMNSVSIISNASAPTNMNVTELDAWAVGSTGTIMHWNGSKWLVNDSPTTYNLNAVWMVNSSSGWAVGGSPTNGVILYYNGTSWSQTTNIQNKVTGNSTIGVTLNSITMDPTGTNGWIVGGAGAVFSLNGTKWVSQANPGNLTLRSVSIAKGSGSVWVVGDNGTILKSSGNGWGKISSNTNATLRSIAVVNDSSGWIVGGDGSQGLILSMNSSGWSKWKTISFSGNVSGHDTVNATLNSLSMAEANSALTVGTGGWSLYWNGTYWAGQTGVIAVTLRGVNMPVNVTNAGWAVGDAGTMLQWNGTGWITQTLTNIPEVPSASVVAPFLFAVLIAVPVLVKKTRKHHLSAVVKKFAFALLCFMEICLGFCCFARDLLSPI